MRRLQHFEHLTTGPRLIDTARGKPVPAGPEEYVRQDVLRSLLNNYGYPIESLLAEEPVGRGTGNRRRADVLVELPTPVVDAHSIETDSSEVPTQDLYRQAQVITERLGRGGAVEIVACPEEMRLDLDGQPVDCRPLGYREVRGGIALVLQCDLYKQLGLPPVFNLMVLGLNLRDIECRVACAFGLPALEFHSGRNREFSESALGSLSRLGLCHPFNKGLHYDQGIGGGLSADGRCGWVVLRADAHAAQGVLARVDLDSPAWHAIEDMHRPTLPDHVHMQDTVWRRAARLDVPTRTLIVVECKAPDVAWSQEVLDQGLDYARTRGARYLVLTSGTNGFTRAYQIDSGEPVEVEDIPTYDQATSNQAFRVRRVPKIPEHSALPPDAEGRSDLLVCHARTRDAVAADLNPRYQATVLRVDDALCDPSFKLGNYLDRFGLTLTDDLGMRWHETSHAAGAIPARYHDWLVRDRSGQEVLVGVTMRALRVVRYHHQWKNLRSKSVLMGATPHGAAIRNEIEYNMGSATIDSTGTFQFTHDGRMSKGGGGQYSRTEVLTYVNQRAPWLVRDGSIALGALPMRRRPTVDELGEFLARFVAYSKLRRDYKLGAH